MQTYLFYDIETTGLNKAFDQVLQFAAIRTDLQLNEIERHEIKVRLNPDIIPSPKAVITHHIGVKDTEDGLSEIEAIKQIHGLLNTPGTISLGYNTLGFDDEFLRFSFYRNLLSPYTHQFANQCSRMDIFPMAAMYFLYKNDIIQWPKKEDGKLSLKLEDINRVNQLASGQAHDAMVDVEITVQLAKRFFAAKDMWDYVIGYFNKQIDTQRSKQSEALMISSVFGGEQFFQSRVLYLGNHRHYKNKQVWLRLDFDKFINPTQEALQDFKIVADKKIGEPGFILPLSERFLRHFTPERQALVDDNRNWLQANPDTFQHLSDYHLNFLYPEITNVDIEAGLYLNGFWSDEENLFCRRFHTASPNDKSFMTDQVKNPKLRNLALRLLGKHFPDAMNAEQREVYEDYLQKVNPLDEQNALKDYRDKKRMTPKLATLEIETLLKDEQLSERQRQLLIELNHYLAKKYTLITMSTSL